MLLLLKLIFYWLFQMNLTIKENSHFTHHKKAQITAQIFILQFNNYQYEDNKYLILNLIVKHM